MGTCSTRAAPPSNRMSETGEDTVVGSKTMLLHAQPRADARLHKLELSCIEPLNRQFIIGARQ